MVNRSITAILLLVYHFEASTVTYGYHVGLLPHVTGFNRGL